MMHFGNGDKPNGIQYSILYSLHMKLRLSHQITIK